MTKQELINFGKKQVEDVIRTQLGKKKYRFLISEIEERLNHHDMVRFEARKIFWDDDKTIIKEIEDNLPYNYYIPLRLEGQLILNEWSQKREEIEYVFDLNINMWFNFDEQNPLFSYDIHDKTKSLLYSYNLRVDNFLKENNLENLQALFQMESQFEGKNSVQFFIEIIRHNDNIPSPFSVFEMYNDIAMCHQDITFALGELFLYKPYISDFTEHSTNIGGQSIFHYFPNFTDKRYLAKCSNLFELFYNYWDKIGDILAPYLAPNLAERDIYFDRVIDRTNFNITNNNFYDWLKDNSLDKGIL